MFCYPLKKSWTSTYSVLSDYVCRTVEGEITRRDTWDRTTPRTSHNQDTILELQFCFTAVAFLRAFCLGCDLLEGTLRPSLLGPPTQKLGAMAESPTRKMVILKDELGRFQFD